MNHEEDLVTLRSIVETALEEVSLAICFHETWKPTVFDESLHQRMGKSFASHSLNTISYALRRELLLSLMRLWDSNKKALRIRLIADYLRKNDFFEYLVADRVRKISPHALQQIRDSMIPKRVEVLNLIHSYMENGEKHKIYENLKIYRNKRLAHRQLDDENVDETERISGHEIDAFYQDTLRIVEILMSLVNGTSIQLGDIVRMHSQYAKLFWMTPMGERTEGHPNYVYRFM